MPVGLSLGGGLRFFVFTLPVFLQVCEKVQGLYQLSLPGRWSLLPLKPDSRDRVKSALLQVVLWELIAVLIFISSSPSLPSPQMLCIACRHSVQDGGTLIIN